MLLTESQQAAVAARGNVLVVAGAGTGKTRTVVERCLNCLLAESPRASLDEILMVTFTEAAAAEMRQRIRSRLEEEQVRAPGDAHWAEQLALFETAHIGTLHSFCFELVRQHFYELELDPQLAVTSEEEARLLADETLEAVLAKCYAGRTRNATAVQQLIQSQAGGGDEPIRKLVLRLHHYTQTLPDHAGWFERQLALFADSEPNAWREWLSSGLAEWRAQRLPELAAHAENQIASKCKTLLEKLGAAADRKEIARILTEVLATVEQCPRGKKGMWIDPLKPFFAEAEFLLSITEPGEKKREQNENTPSGTASDSEKPLKRLASTVPEITRLKPSVNEKIPDTGANAPAAADSGVDPLAEDWDWVRPQMTTVLQLAREFSAQFTEAKRELGLVDFHDLEQFALRLLWDSRTAQATAVARHWRGQLRFIFVDEYQDINAVQDKIIEALSRDGAAANRFLVGDVKQSIYRFRLANPYIFQGYVEKWGGSRSEVRSEASPAPSTVIALSDNFRSRAGLLNFVNSLFGLTMRPDLGGVAYDDLAQLRFGAPEERAARDHPAGTRPVVELHARIKQNTSDNSEEETDPGLLDIAEMQESAREARLVALRLLQLKEQQWPIWDEKPGRFRPADWRDMTLLLRSPSNKAETYAKEFAHAGVPLEVERGGFYQSPEVMDLLALLQVLDNPLQDLPLIAVLHSPLVGLNLNELAEVRLALLKARFWTALVRWHESTSPAAEPQQTLMDIHKLRAKVSAFLDRYTRWRRLAREMSLSRCLEVILADTHYADWLLTQPRGEQRRSNLQRLLGLAQDFDQFQRQGLFRFLRFIEAQQLAEAEPEVGATAEVDAVRLMSIHQSKGLEFPIVVVADTGKLFNLADLHADNILDETYGLCPQVRPPQTATSYPSLPHWLARRRQHRELLGEELRLLYVATTRARDLLLLSATVPRKQFENLWQGAAEPAAALKARSYADWLGLWFSKNVTQPVASSGDAGQVHWIMHEDADLIAPAANLPIGSEASNVNGSPPEIIADLAVVQELDRRLLWRYPFTPATQVPAKTSVSRLRHEAIDDESADFAPSVPAPRRASFRPASARASAADIGLAHHHFLQLVSLDQTLSAATLEAEGKRLRDSGLLPADEFELLDFRDLARFWAADLGQQVREQAQFVHRELPFTARFFSAELARITGKPLAESLREEFVIVQGIADLAVIRSDEIRLVDFKTDAIGPEMVPDRAKLYEPQLQLYALALARIYQRPVTECWLYFLATHTAVIVPVPGGKLVEQP